MLGAARQLWSSIRERLRRRRFEAEMAEEVRLHLEYDTEANLRAGMTPEEARAAALRRFGGTEQVKELCRDQLRMLWFEQLVQDVRFAVRSTRKQPGFALMAVAIIALGIGATTATFSVTDFVLLRPLPFPDPARLVKVWECTPGYNRMELSAPNYRDWQAAAKSFVSLGAYHYTAATLERGSEPQRLQGVSVTADVFPTLGVQPILGRSFTPADDQPGAPRTVVLGYDFWQTEFARSPDIIGQHLVLNSEPYLVIGVMGADFHFPTSGTQYWDTAQFSEADYQDGEISNNWLDAVGRLAPGVSLEQARAEVALLAKRSEIKHPKEDRDTTATVVRLTDEISGPSRLLLLTLCGAATCLLLTVCANLGTLLIARALGRQREFAVRAALGATRGRIIRQLIAESVVLAGVGGAIGVALAIAAVPLLARLVPASLPIAATPTVDTRILLCSVGLTLLSGLAFGLAPALRVRDLDGLRHGGRVAGGPVERLRSGLIVAEVAASVVLLVATGLLARALITVENVDPGFRPDGVLTLRTELSWPQYDSVARREAYYDRVLTGIRALPGVQSAGFISFIPLGSMRGGIWPVVVAGREAEIRSSENTAALRYATPGFFPALRIPLRRGRDIVAADRQDSPYVAVVSESFARRYWPGQDPIGRHFTFAFHDREIVGVVGDIRFRGLERSAEPQAYLPSSQVPDGDITYYAPQGLVIRTNRPNPTLATAVRQIIHAVDPQIPITELQPMTNVVEQETAPRVTQVRVLALFTFVAIVLAAVGIHGLLSFSISQRAKELAIRRALGAQNGAVLWLVLRQASVLAAVGLIPGVFFAYVAARSLGSLLAGIRPDDGASFVIAITVCAAMTIIGSLRPAYRAIRVDPITALRLE